MLKNFHLCLWLFLLPSIQGLGCPWHGEDWPASEGHAYKELTLVVEDHVKQAIKSHVIDADGFLLRNLYGYECMLSPYAHGSGLARQLDCQKGAQAIESTLIACEPYQDNDSYAEWSVTDPSGMSLLTVKMSCAAKIF